MNQAAVPELISSSTIFLPLLIGQRCRVQRRRNRVSRNSKRNGGVMDSTERFLLVVVLAMAACMACGGLQRAVGAPVDSYSPTRLNVVIDGVPEAVDGAVVTPRFFAAEGVQPFLGRFFLDAEYESGQQATTVLSHEYWTKRLRSASNVIGSTITIEGRSRVIVGVAPAAFHPDRGGALWIPKGG